jgi:type II secretory pathway pseudopilin PulG
MKTRSATPPARGGEVGFSVLELVAVMAVMGIMLGLALWQYVPRKRAFAADDAAVQVLDFVRTANQRALAERQTMRLEVDLANRRIKITDENGPGVADDAVVREEALPSGAEVAVKKPTSNAPPALPSPFDTVAVEADTQLVSGVWQANFLSNGSVVNPADSSPRTTTFYFWQPPGGNASATGPAGREDVRVATVYGASSSSRLWRYTGAQWVRR